MSKNKLFIDAPSGMDLSGSGAIEREGADYPPLLSCIKNPPKRLYFIGNKELMKRPCVAVVGSRHATGYGKWAAYEIGRRLAECGITVVSGMAAGIDSFSHKGALAAGGNTIAVLGSGLGYCCPTGNIELMREIARRGLIVTEYEENIHASAFTFPTRNRIISGLSMAVVVVEAAVKSGSLITAERAMEQGREVFCVPGNINSIYSLGVNKLIRDGAKAISVVDDILDDLGLAAAEERESLVELGEDERLIYDALKKGGECSADGISRATGLDSATVAATLTILEMKGLCRYELGKAFCV